MADPGSVSVLFVFVPGRAAAVWGTRLGIDHLHLFAEASLCQLAGGGGGSVANGGGTSPLRNSTIGKVGVEDFRRASWRSTACDRCCCSGTASLSYSMVLGLWDRRRGTVALSAGTPLDIWLVTLAWIFFDLCYLILFRRCIGYGTTLLLWYPRRCLRLYTCSRITGFHSICATTCLDLSCLCRPTAHAYRWEC